MKYIINYYAIPYGGHLFAIPEYHNSEHVEVSGMSELNKYILSKKDLYGNKFKKKKSFGFDYISNAGAIKVKEYKPPKFKIPKFKRI